MLHFTNNILAGDSFKIDTPDYIFELKPDIIDCKYFGIITFPNNIVKTIQFVEFPNVFRARLHLTKEDLQNVHGATFKLLSVSASFSKESNQIPLVFDTNKIELLIKQETSKNILELNKKVADLESRIEALSLGKVVPNINITNKDYIKPGMVLVAIDEGNFTAAYPFADIITEVNGQHAVDGVVQIEASMIKYNTERTIVDQFYYIAKAIQSQSEAVKTLANELSSIQKKLAELSIKVETHLDSGIV